MVFSSITFIFFFLPTVLLLYFLSPARLRNTVILLFSLLFYAWGEPVYIVIMIISCLSGYIHGRLIEKHRGKSAEKPLLISSILVSSGLLLYFKYTDFLISNLNNILQSEFELTHLALPIGISFYTFQIISYTIDVYRGQTAAQKNLLNFAVYVTFFPQLIAGPIVRYKDISSQLTKRPGASSNSSKAFRILVCENLAGGIRRFSLGLGKKVLLANSFGELVKQLEAAPEISISGLWLTALAFLLQIYFDFSGYSDMAIGLSRMFGFNFPENFNYPLIAASISDFWRRWHISLGSWFRDYVYIPLGGSRGSFTSRNLNLLIVWFLTGLWHGAQWNFVIWGLFFALLLAVEKALVKPTSKLPVLIRYLITIVLILISFAVFKAKSANDAFLTVRNMFAVGSLPAIEASVIYYFRSYGLLLLIGIIGATPLPKNLMMTTARLLHSDGSRASLILRSLSGFSEAIFILFVLTLVTAGIVNSSFNPFIYFRF